ncbi:restriction endonuclease subunit S [Streptomyces sp. NPDC014744]|uniref:restriction endonuclease subunit S n=1 Tax=Streptomyces sp. NPDC014744 TaxID=3364903 RepID=UPI0036FB3F00
MSAEPDEIRWVPVGEVGEVRMGKQLSPASSQADGMHAPYLRVANVLDGRIDYSDVKTMSFSPAERQKYVLEPGDILLNEGQSLELVGRSAIYDGPRDKYCFQNTLIRFRSGPGVVPAYAREVFKAWLNDGTFASVAKKTTSIAHLGGDRFAKLDFPLLSLARQRRIVEILDSVAESERVVLTEVAKLQTIRKVLIEHMSLFEFSPMVDFIVDGPRNGIYKPEDCYGQSGAPIVRINSFEGGPSDLTRGLLRVKASDSELLRYGVSVGDVLINRVNAPGLVGKATMVTALEEPTLFESNIMRCRVDTFKIQPKIVEAWLSGSVARAHFASRTKPAVSQASINRSDVFSCPVPKMAPGDQAEFLERIEALDVAIAESRAQLAKLGKLQKGLVSDLLSGKALEAVRS